MDNPQSIIHNGQSPVYRFCDAGPESLSSYSDNSSIAKRNLMQVVDAFHDHSVDSVVTEIAHEISQPLTSISLLTDNVRVMILSGRYNADEIDDSLMRIDSQAKRAIEVINELRRFSLDNTLNKEATPVNVIIREVVDLIDIEVKWNHIKLEVHLLEESAIINVDKILIEQVVLNLVRNSIEAMKNNTHKKRELYISARCIDDEVMICVEDTGSGMTDEQSKQAFNAFYSSKQGGMGMGLVISRNIVRAHDGNIGFESGLDAGSKFYFILSHEKKRG